MKLIILPVCALGLLSVAVADDIRPQINAMNDAVVKALKNKDIAAFSAAMKGHVTADFKYFDSVGAKPMTFDQMVSVMKGGLAMMTSMRIVETRILSLKAVGDTTTVLVSHHMTGMTVGKDKKPTSMAFAGVSIDVFKKSAGVWKMASMTWKTQEQTIGGHHVFSGK